MGWKAVRDHYGIKHIVCVNKEGICIGSPYIHNIMVIGADGTLTHRYEDHDQWSMNEDLARYQREMDADPEMLRKLVLQPDTFGCSLTVWTWDGGEVLEKRCEVLGWPHVTHDGMIQFGNRFSADRRQVVAWAIRDAELRVRYAKVDVSEAEQELAKRRARLEDAEASLAKLTAG